MQKCTITMFFALNAFRTRECEHLSLERHLLELLPGFSVFLMALDTPGKVLISHNIETSVCDSSDIGVA